MSFVDWQPEDFVPAEVAPASPPAAPVDDTSWERNSFTFRVHPEDAAVFFDMPWLIPDPNPFPRLRLWSRRRAR